MKKAWVVSSLARMVDGEYCFAFIEYSAFSKEKAEQFLINNKMPAVRGIPTPNGEVQCLVERAVIEINIEE